MQLYELQRKMSQNLDDIQEISSTQGKNLSSCSLQFHHPSPDTLYGKSCKEDITKVQDSTELKGQI